MKRYKKSQPPVVVKTPFYKNEILQIATLAIIAAILAGVVIGNAVFRHQQSKDLDAQLEMVTKQHDYVQAYAAGFQDGIYALQSGKFSLDKDAFLAWVECRILQHQESPETPNLDLCE